MCIYACIHNIKVIFALDHLMNNGMKQICLIHSTAGKVIGVCG